MFALALTGGAVLAWHQVKTDKEFQLRAYRMCLIILEQLANVDPGWQGAVSIAHEWTGEVLHDQGKLNEALASPDDFRFLEYSGLVVLTTSLSESDPSATCRIEVQLYHFKTPDSAVHVFFGHADRLTLPGSIAGSIVCLPNS